MIGFVYIAALPDNYRRSAAPVKTPFYKPMEMLKTVGRPQQASASQAESNHENDSSAHQADAEEIEVWICRKCNTSNNVKYGQCKKCGEYRGLKGTL